MHARENFINVNLDRWINLKVYAWHKIFKAYKYFLLNNDTSNLSDGEK